MDRLRQTRRQILKGAVGGAAGIVLGTPVLHLGALAQPSSEGAGTLRLSDDVFVVRIPGEANVIAHTGPEGVLLVDGGSAGASDALMKAVAALPGGGPVRTIFNTHWHPEQTGSNERLGKAGGTIVAHENTRLWLTTDVTWPGAGGASRVCQKPRSRTRRSYDRRARSAFGYGYLPDAAHTDGDLYVYFPKQNVLAVGDAVSGEGWPVVDWATGGWIGGSSAPFSALQTLANADTRIVAGRGRVLGLADLKKQYEMYGTIYDRLSKLLNAGRGPSEAVAAQPTQEFDAQMGNPDEFVRRAFESLWAYVSPDACENGTHDRTPPQLHRRFRAGRHVHGLAGWRLYRSLKRRRHPLRHPTVRSTAGHDQAGSCVGCHNERAKTAGVSFEGLTPANVGERAEVFEKAVRKLRGASCHLPAPGSRNRQLSTRWWPGSRVRSTAPGAEAM